APQLALSWDATRDGRTVVRSGISSGVDAGSFGQALALPEGGAPAPRTWEAAAGGDGEIEEGMAASADLVQRWRDAGPHRGLTLTLRKRQGRTRVAASYVRQTTSGAENAFTLAATEQLPCGLGVGLLAAYAHPTVWAR